MTNAPATRAAADDASAFRLAAVAPDDAAELPFGICRALFVGEAGDVVLEAAGGGVVTIASAASQYHPVRARRVLTGTTAGRIVALY